MKKPVLIFLITLLCNVCASQENDTLLLKPLDETFYSRLVEMKDAEGRRFKYLANVTPFNTNEIRKYFKIPEDIAAKYPLQIVFLKNYQNLNNIKLEDVIGISAYSYFHERIEHQFFKLKNSFFVEEKKYAAIFRISPRCDYYFNIFQIELAKTPYVNNNAAYFVIKNKDVEFSPKTEKDLLFTAAYYSLLGIKDERNPKYLAVKKSSDSLGFNLVKAHDFKVATKP